MSDSQESRARNKQLNNKPCEQEGFSLNDTHDQAQEYTMKHSSSRQDDGLEFPKVHPLESNRCVQVEHGSGLTRALRASNAHPTHMPFSPTQQHPPPIFTWEAFKVGNPDSDRFSRTELPHYRRARWNAAAYHSLGTLQRRTEPENNLGLWAPDLRCPDRKPELHRPRKDSNAIKDVTEPEPDQNTPSRAVPMLIETPDDLMPPGSRLIHFLKALNAHLEEMNHIVHELREWMEGV